MSAAKVRRTFRQRRRAVEFFHINIATSALLKALRSSSAAAGAQDRRATINQFGVILSWATSKAVGERANALERQEENGSLPARGEGVLTDWRRVKWYASRHILLSGHADCQLRREAAYGQVYSESSRLGA